MTQDEQLEAARRAVRNAKPPSIVALDAAALDAARGMPVVVDLGQIVDFLSGASTSGNKANNNFTNAADQSQSYYGNALKSLVNSTGTGSPAAQTFGAEQQAALQPMFQQQKDQLAGSNAAQGITNSGSGAYNNTQLAADQGATLAGAIAPLYSNALSEYGNITGQGAATQSGLVGQGAAANNAAYGQSIQDFYGAAESAGTGIPAGNANPYSGQSTSSATAPGVGSGTGPGVVGPNTATATYGSYAY